MKSKLKKTLLLLMFVLSALIVLGVPAQAAKHKKNSWETTGSGYVRYYGKDRKAVKGFVKIKKKKYCFDEKTGNQLTGWRKIGKSYYFFKKRSGKYGYMVTKQRINGIYLKKNGQAYLPAGDSREKVELMCHCQILIDSITGPKDSLQTKLYKAFVYLRENTRESAVSEKSLDNFGLTYAMEMLYQGLGDCVSYGSSFAFLANACGSKVCYAEASTGHGWAKVDGLYYDPEHANTTGDNQLNFAVPPSLSGANGRPDWANNAVYTYLV